MKAINKAPQPRMAAPILGGLLYAYVCMGLAALLVSLLLTLTGMKEETMNVYAFFIHGLAIFVGGFVCGRKAGAKGWYSGGLLGLVYSLIIILVAFLGFDTSIGLPFLVLIGLSIIMGMLGGIVGVNAAK